MSQMCTRISSMPNTRSPYLNHLNSLLIKLIKQSCLRYSGGKNLPAREGKKPGVPLWLWGKGDHQPGPPKWYDHVGGEDRLAAFDSNDSVSVKWADANAPADRFGNGLYLCWIWSGCDQEVLKLGRTNWLGMELQDTSFQVALCLAVATTVAAWSSVGRPSVQAP